MEQMKYGCVDDIISDSKSLEHDITLLWYMCVVDFLMMFVVGSWCCIGLNLIGNTEYVTRVPRNRIQNRQNSFALLSFIFGKYINL